MKYLFQFLLITHLSLYVAATTVHIRDSIVNGTSAIFVTSIPPVTDTLSSQVQLPLNYSLSTPGSLYTGTQAYTAYSFGSIKMPGNYLGLFNVICGTFDYMKSTAASNYHPGIICYSFNSSCDTFYSVETTWTASDQGLATHTNNYMSIAPRIFQSSSYPNTAQPSNYYTDTWGIIFPVTVLESTSTSTSNMQFLSVRHINTSSIAIDMITFPSISYASTYLTSQPYSDTFYTSGNLNAQGIYGINPTNFQSAMVTCSNSTGNCVQSFSYTITGYTLLNHYASSFPGSTAKLPLYIISNTTDIILATPNSGDISLASGLLILAAAPIVGCTPDRGTMINWRNLANPYPNTVHLYTMCNFVVTNTTVAATGAVYEILISGSTYSFSRWKTLPNLYTAVDLEVIGEYGQILTTNDVAGTSPRTMTPGLYSLYDPYNPVYIGYATLDAAQNPANTVSNTFLSIAGDMTYSGICASTNITWYTTNQMYNGLDLSTLNFCGSGNTLYNNLTYCDGPGVCCSDYCQYYPTYTPCPNSTNTTVNICGVGYCVQGDVNCVGNAALNGTIVQNATACETAYYCNGTGGMVNGTYLSNTTVCNSGNVSYCVEPAYCTGSSATCPNNTVAANGTQCGTFLGICYSNDTCVNGVCTIGTPLPNGTIVIPATVCSSAYYCDGAGNLVNSTKLPNGTIVTPATNCTSAYYCDGAGNLVNGTNFPNGTLVSNVSVCLMAAYCDGAGNIVPETYQPSTYVCSAGNVSACLGPANCTGNSSSCPANPVLPNNTPCSNTSSCGGNFTDVCTSGTCGPNVMCNCSTLYPCANYTTAVNSTCVPSGLKPAGSSCNTSSPTTVGACMIPGGACSGTSTQCPSFSFAPDGTNCSIVVSVSCNETGVCQTGNCIFTPNCTAASPIPNSMVATIGISYDPSSLTIGLVTGFIGGLGLIVLLLIAICFSYVIFLYSRRGDNEKEE